MKTILSILFALFVLTNVNAQNQFVQNGNQITEIKTPATEASLSKNATKTDLVCKAGDGKTYPVYKSANDKLFVVKVSKAGNAYKYYINKSN
jgi:hypothetical protein